MKHLRVGNSVAGIMLAAALALADCSGSAVAPAVPAVRAAAQTAKASFTIRWPSRAVAAVRTGRKPLFISPSALSVIVEVNPTEPTAGPVTFANANGSATSTVSIDAPVGSDEFIFTLWDTLQKPNETQPTGNLLGQADVPAQPIAAGRTNVVNATIGGVTQHISAAPVAGQPFVETDASGGYDLVGDMPVTFSATSYDAGGNVIVAPGAPTLSFSGAGSSSSTIDVLPVSGNPNRFTIAAKSAPPATTNPLAVLVTASDAGVVHTTTANVTIRMRSALYVSYAVGTGSKIAAYDNRGNAIKLPAGAFAGLVAPGALAYGAKEHRLFIADNSSGKILAFDTAGNSAGGFVPAAVAGVRSMAYDAQSDTIYASGTAGVVAFKPNGTIVALAANAFSQTASADAIAAVGVDPVQGGSADIIAVANDATLSIDYYHADGTYISSDALTAPPAAAPIAGLVWSPPSLGAPMLVTGGTAAAGFAFAENVGGGPDGSPIASTTTRFGQIALDSTIMHEVPSVTNSTLGEVFVVQPDAGDLQGYALDSGDFSQFNAPDITIPAQSGFSNPIGVAIAL